MNISIKSVLTIVSFAAALPSVWAQTHDLHQHHHHQDTEQVLQLNDGKKWQIDQSLHTGMTAIKNLIAQDVDAIHVNDYSPSQYQALAEQLDLQLKYLFKHCKLPPAADAQLHVLLARVMQASHQMKQQQAQKSGVISVIKVMQDYAQYFDDPNWQPLVH